MKKTLSFLLSLVMIFGILVSVPVPVAAADESDLIFTLSDSGTYYSVSGCSPDAKGEIIVPGEYSGLPVKIINGYAFKGCTKVTSIIVSDGVSELGWYAFADCTNLTSVTLGKDINTFGLSMFDKCPNIASIYVDKNNTKYTSEKGVLFNKNKTQLLQYPLGKADKTYTVPDTVTEIFQGAFRGNMNLTTVKIPGSVTYIDVFAFAFSDKLKSVIISDGVESIGAFAFVDCKNLTSIVVPGSVNSIAEKAFGFCYTPTYEIVKTDGFEICGTKGSVAESYALENGFSFVEYKECKHSSTKWVTVKKSTVNAPGSKQQKCIECGEVLKTEKIPQLKCSSPKLESVTNVATGIKFTWNKVSGADNYEVYRKIGSGKWTKIATVKGSVTSYTDKTAKSGKTYKYSVSAKNEAGSSKCNTTGLTIKCLSEPVLKTPTSTKNGVTLKWSKVTGSQGYVIYRKAGSGKFVKLATVKGATKVSYVDKSAKKGTKYTYKLKAYSGKTNSVYSNAKTIKDKY